MRRIILYTANLHGDIEALPRLHSFLRGLRHDLSARLLPDEDGGEVQVCDLQPVNTRFHLLDLGGWDAPEVWHCAATGGRSMLIAMDALGYDAVQVSQRLSAESRARLTANHLAMQLLDGASFAVGEAPALQVHLHPSAETRLDQGTLRLCAVQAGQVGMAHLVWRDHQPDLIGYGTWDMPTRTPPDATITAAVDFILAEARRKPS